MSARDSKGVGRQLLWMALGGVTYYGLEGVWHIPSNGGWAHVSMLLVGGLCFVLLGSLNQRRDFYHLPMRVQALAGALLVTAVEFVSGCVLNRWLRLDIWDYSHMPLNLLGQVCLLYTCLWLLLMPFAYWLEDFLNIIWWKARGGPKPEYEYSLFQAYRELLLGK